MKTLFSISLILALSSAVFATKLEKIDTSIVFKESKSYLEAKSANPDARLAIQEGARRDNYVEIAVIENHETHVVTLARLRVYSTGKILRMREDKDGEEVWISDNRVPNDKRKLRNK